MKEGNQQLRQRKALSVDSVKPGPQAKPSDSRKVEKQIRTVGLRGLR